MTSETAQTGAPRLSIKLARGGRSHEYALLMRNEVFVRELRMFAESDLDEHDADAIHLIAFYGDEPVGAVRLNDMGRRWTGSRLQVLPECRGRGIGATLVRAAEAVAQAGDCEVFTAVVREDRAGLFARLGWHDEGAGPTISGVPHRHMRSPLDSGALLYAAGANERYRALAGELAERYPDLVVVLL